MSTPKRKRENELNISEDETETSSSYIEIIFNTIKSMCSWLDSSNHMENRKADKKYVEISESSDKSIQSLIDYHENPQIERFHTSTSNNSTVIIFCWVILMRLYKSW